MNNLKRFLESNFYPLLIVAIGFTTWMLPKEFLWLNNLLMSILVFFGVSLLIFFKNTKYIIPIVLTMLFAINIESIGISDIKGFTIYHLLLGLVLVALITHFVRFRQKLKFDFISFGLLLVAVSYVIPLFYMPYSTLLLSMSLTGFLYFLFYLFLRSTANVTTDEVLNYFFFASLQLLAIMLYTMGTGFLELLQENTLQETFSQGLKTSWGKSDYGFGNINDLTIFLSILSAGVFYKIIKHSDNYLYWIVAIAIVVAILFSGSRGGLITLTLMLLTYLVVLVVYGKKQQVIFITFLMIATGFLIYRYDEIAIIFYENFIQGGLDDLESFSGGRIELYKKAFDVFKEYPLFGAGWTVLEANNENRVQIFHSTVFHTLAITGLAGMAAVFVLVIASFSTLLKKFNRNVLILGVPWTMTMIHGLIDNTVHMAIFTILSAILFTAVQNVEDDITKEKKEFFDYLLIDELHT